jgi:cytochrome c oxidase subunit 2
MIKPITPDQANPRRVLIASSHALFGKGLRSLLQERQPAGVEVVGMVSNLEEAMVALDRLNPDLVIVDYDDEALNRDEFLARFVEGEKKLRVVLLSLQSGKEALVYDRRTLAASQIDDWLEEWTYADETSKPPAEGKGAKSAILANSENSENSPNSSKSAAEHRRTNMKHLVIAGILVVLVTALLILGLNYVQLLPEQASVQAEPIDSLFSLEFKVIAFLFSLIVVFMLYSIVVFRRKPGDTADAAHIEGNTKLEVAWTLAPLATVLVFAYLGGGALADTLRADPKALEIRVIGQQWSWRFEYPQYGIVSDTMYMPVDKQAILKLSSNDVIHSFWVPEFRVKQDALPGGKEFERTLRVTPSQTGDFKVRCAELCGVQHAYMESPVKVVAQADFDAWVAEQTGISADPVERGARWAQQYGCLACHSVDGSKTNANGVAYLGPTWQGIFGEQATMADGTVVTVDEAYLRESIINPGKLIVQGYPANIMPANFSAQLTEEQIQDLIAYIMSLK